MATKKKAKVEDLEAESPDVDEEATLDDELDVDEDVDIDEDEALEDIEDDALEEDADDIADLDEDEDEAEVDEILTPSPAAVVERSGEGDEEAQRQGRGRPASVPHVSALLGVVAGGGWGGAEGGNPGQASSPTPAPVRQDGAATVRWTSRRAPPGRRRPSRRGRCR